MLYVLQELYDLQSVVRKEMLIELLALSVLGHARSKILIASDELGNHIFHYSSFHYKFTTLRTRSSIQVQLAGSQGYLE